MRMKRHEIIKYINVTSDIHGKMPDIEQVRAKCLNQSADEILGRDNAQRKRPVINPAKIIATVTALIVLVGLINIQTVIAFFSGLFFVPGAGVTEVNVINYGLDKPIDIETEYGLMTLKIANKTTKNGRTDLWFYIYSKEINAPRARNGEYPLIVSIAADGEMILSGADLFAAAGWGSDGINEVTYGYLYENFPEVNDFTLIFDNLGVETHVSLSYQPNNFALSQENNGITLAASKFSGLTDMFAQDIYDSSENAREFNVFGSAYFDISCYDEAGEEIRMTGGWGGYDPDSPLNYQMANLYENEREIKSIKANQLRLMYNRFRKDPSAIEIPVPKDGETMQVNIEMPIGSHTFRITELRREGDTIYYESNSHEVLAERANSDVDIGSFTSRGIPASWDEDKTAYEQAVANSESYIECVSFGPVSDLYTTTDELIEMYHGAFPKMGGGQIWSFDEKAETLTFYFAYAAIIQFGNFDITFE